ncbi:hypothetical protein FRC01_006718 [Tulasnella sp. 417]|nr:hypothetical protein FRC01_006718 [Tulasnella sp. 417]
MLALPQDIINDVAELILNHIRQTMYAEGDQPHAPELGGSGQTYRNGEKKLQGLDAEIHALEEAFTSLQTGLRTSITQRKKQRNSLIHLNRLPIEIASKVLWLAVADPWQQKISFSFLRRLETISSVCSSWRALVQSSPRFWSVIEFSNPEPVILDLLRKSGSTGLDIRCFSDGNYNCMHHSGLSGSLGRRHLNLIIPHTDRIQSLSLAAYAAHGLLPILEKPAPVLEELRLELMEESFGEPLDLFCGQAGRLRDVVLENIPFRWDSAVLAGLRSLKISSRFDYPPSPVQVRRLLEENPGLETMDIEDVAIRGPERLTGDAVESSGRGKPSRVGMSKMQKLRLYSLRFELLQAILDNVEIPSIQHFDLWRSFRGQPASRLLGLNMKPLVAPLLRRSQGTRRAEITFEKTSIGFELFFGREDPTIRIELPHIAPMNGFDWLVENFSLAEDLPSVCAVDAFQVSLTFWSHFDMAGGAFIPILDRLGAVKVKALTIESTCRNGEQMVDYLGELNKDSQWPLPHLTSLTIGGRAELADHLLSVLQRRTEAAPEGAVNPLRPVLLEVLDLGALEVSARADMDEALAKCVSSSGTFTRASWLPFMYRPGLVEDWDDLDHDDDEEEEIDYNYEPSVLW